MSWGEFKYPLSYLCLASSVVTIWSLIQEVADSNDFFTNILSLISVKTFTENSNKQLP